MRYIQTVFTNDDFFQYMGCEQYYFLGLLASDGHLSKSNRISISQSKETGLEIISYIKNIISYTGDILITTTAAKNLAYTLSFSSKKYLPVLKLFNITQKKSLTYQYPFNAMPELIPSFVRGYFDGDGCIGIYKVGGTENFLKMSIYGSFDFIDSLNRLCPIKGVISKRKTGAEINWNGKHAVAFGLWLYQDNSFCSHKQKLFNHYMTTFFKEDPYKQLKQQAKLLYNNGYAVTEIANLCKVSFQTIYKWRKQWN